MRRSPLVNTRSVGPASLTSVSHFSASVCAEICDHVIVSRMKVSLEHVV